MDDFEKEIAEQAEAELQRRADEAQDAIWLIHDCRPNPYDLMELVS
jgi:hypothetical protein